MSVLGYASLADVINLGGLPRVFAIGSDGGLYAAQQLGTEPAAWGPWEALPVPGVGVSTEAPSILAAAVGALVWVVVRGADENLWAIGQGPIEPGRWSVPENLGAPQTRVGPKVVFATGALAGQSVGGIWTVGYDDGQLWSVWPDPDGGGWGDWAPTGAPGGGEIYALTSFCLGCDAVGALHCFALAPDATLWDLRVPLADVPYGGGTPWSELTLAAGSPHPALARRPGVQWLELGAMATNADANGNLEVYVIDDRGTLWGRGQTARVTPPAVPAWSGWQTRRAPVGGLAAGPVGLAASHNRNGTEVLAAIDRQGQQPWYIYNTPRRAAGGANVGLLGGWSEWMKCGADSLEDIQATVDPDGRIQLFALSDGALCHVWELETNIDEFVGLCERRVLTSDPPVSQDQVWSTWGIVDSDTSTGTLYTSNLFRPTSVYGIAASILAAEAAGQTVRALGSGWSFSDVSLPQTSPLPAGQVIDDLLTDNVGDLFAHAGYAVDIAGCNGSLQDELPSILLPGVQAGSLWFTEAGITIGELNNELSRLPEPLALATMGGSSGQTLAGAIATGTHGMDFDRPPLADSVRAIYIVGAGGTHYWLEPSDPITDPRLLQATFPCMMAENICYDDDLFRSALVSLGGMGVVYAVILDVVAQYALVQLNTWTTWEFVSSSGGIGALFEEALMDSPFREALEAMFPGGAPLQYRSAQVVVNPIHKQDGTHSCYVATRFEVPLGQVPDWMSLPAGPASTAIGALTSNDILKAILAQPECGLGGRFVFGAVKLLQTLESIVNELSTAIAGQGSAGSGQGSAGSGQGSAGGGQGSASTGQASPQALLANLNELVGICKDFNYYWAIRAVIDLILQGAFPVTTSQLQPNPQVNLGFEIMTAGALPTNILKGNITSVEACFSFSEAAAFVTELLQEFDDVNVPDNVFPAGYVSLRACGPTQAILGMEQFGSLPFDPATADCTGAAEMSLLSNQDGETLIRDFEVLAMRRAGNLHWGQSNGLMDAAYVALRYAELDKWVASQGRLGGKTFANEFMQRCGLV